MATLTIAFDNDNAAFDVNPGAETARILRAIADRCEGNRAYSGPVRDTNGNTIGAVVWDGADEEED